jgi:tungstate transport system permease protein
MEYLIDTFIRSLEVLTNFNGEVYEIVLLSIRLSAIATVISLLIAVPFSIFVSSNEFKFKKSIISFINAMATIPPIVVGIIVAIFLTRYGPFGEYRLLFTREAVVIAQVFIISPIISSIIMSHYDWRKKAVSLQTKMLKVSWIKKMHILMLEEKDALILSATTGFGRGISEVGAVMVVGGNIEGHTRVMTTFIALNKSMGKYDISLAMGIIIITIGLCINYIALRMKRD